ncbi:MAG: flagellar hook-associated protein FlgK [Methylococcaceae bacterium]
MSVLATATSGLLAAQRTLETISHNITNAGTVGYSRQTAEYGTKPAERTGAGYIGQGVNITTVSRSYDQFITARLNASTASFAEADGFSTMATQVDDLVSNATSGVPVALKSFFNMANEVANNPTSIPVRQAMLSGADAVAKSFNDMSAQLSSFRTQVNGQMQSMVTDVNSMAKTIAELNVKIVTDTRSNGGQQPNDLLDQRDTLLNKIAQNVGVSSITQTDGTVSVFVGNGLPLVLGINSYVMSTAPSSTDGRQLDILVNGQNITPSITGGALSGALKFRDTVLDPAQQQLGLVAAGFAGAFNQMHKAGYDLNGALGTAMFSVEATSASPVPVTSSSGIASTITAAYDPATLGNLQASDYRLDYDGAAYSLTRLSDNKAIFTAGALPATVEGMMIDVTTAPTAGQSFLIRPTYDAASLIKSLITDPKLVAAADSNLLGPQPGNNKAALKFAALENTPLFGGSVSLNGAYGALVSNVATLTQSGQNSSAAQQTLLNSVKQTQSNLAGVNLDEEAANLIKFQNAYQASAKAVSIANSLFTTLIGAIA